MSKGYVYILTNPALREVDAVVNGKNVKVEPVKIGMTKDVAKRLGVLNTSTPENFVDRLIVELASERDALVLENMVHEKLEDYRIMTEGGGSTEFFNCSVEVAKETVRRLAKKLHFELVNYKRINCESRSAHSIARELSKRELRKAKITEKAARTDGARGSTKQPNFSFAAVGIRPGDELRFTESPITVTVADEKNKVTYQGKPYSLSGFVKAFHPHPSKSGAYQGPRFFTYKGKLLVDMRNGGSVTQKPVEPSEWKNSTQLAKAIVEKYNGGKSKENVWCILNRKRPVATDSKWRSILEEVGLTFDRDNRVVDWRLAKRDF